MIAILILLVIANSLIYFYVRSSEDETKDKKYAFRNYFFLSTMLYLFIMFFLKVKPPFLMNSYVALAIAFIIVFLFIRYLGTKKQVDTKIKAQRMSYWGIDFEKILEKYKNRTVKKKGRNEIEVEEDYFVTIDKKDGSKALQPIILSDIATPPDLKLVHTVQAIRDTGKELYVKLLDKLEEFKEEAELEIDFEAVLKENKYILEFFFIDLWERVAMEENINSTTLSPIVEDENDIQLISALDSAKSMNVQKEGTVLFAHYLNFKGRVE